MTPRERMLASVSQARSRLYNAVGRGGGFVTVYPVGTAQPPSAAPQRPTQSTYSYDLKGFSGAAQSASGTPYMMVRAVNPSTVFTGVSTAQPGTSMFSAGAPQPGPVSTWTCPDGTTCYQWQACKCSGCNAGGCGPGGKCECIGLMDPDHPSGPGSPPVGPNRRIRAQAARARVRLGI